MRVMIVPLLLLLASPAWAQVDSKPLTEAEKQEKLGRASSLKAEASRIQQEADATLKAQTEACHKKFLVSSCLEDVGKTHTQTVREAKRKQLEAGELERDVKRREVAAKDAKKAAEAPQRAADEKAKAEAYRAEEAAKAQKRAEKETKKKEQAALGRQKHAEAQARYQKKQEEQAKKEAKYAEKRKKKEEREAQKAAKEAKRLDEEAARAASHRLW